METPKTRDRDDLDELPEALLRELRAAEKHVPLITARVDREVLGMARAQFASRRPVWRRPAWAAAAAAVLLAVLIVPNSDRLTTPPPAADISDVLAMARARAGEPGAQTEIDALAMRIVSLDTAGDAP